MTSMLVACGDGVIIGNQNTTVANDATTTQSPFAVSTPAGTPNVTAPTAPVSDQQVPFPAPGSTDETLVQVGLFVISQTSAPATSSAFGTFLEGRSALASDLPEIFVDPNEDSCEVLSDFDDGSLENSSQTISAGEVLTLTSPAGTFAELVREISADEISYSIAQGSVESELPASLTLDIPGDAFPAFSNIAVPVVQALDVISPVIGQAINIGTAFSWVAGNNPNAYIEIEATGTINGESATVTCNVQDDGSFTFPVQTANELGTNFSVEFFSITREVQTSVVNGNAIVIVNSISE